MIGLVNQYRNLFLLAGFENLLKLLFRVNISHGVIRVQKNQKLGFLREIFQNARNGHFQVFGIRDGNEIPAIHFRINLEHEIRRYNADNPSAFRSEGLDNVTDSFGRTIYQTKMVNIRFQILGQDFRKMQGFRILGNKLRRNIIQNFPDKFFRKAARIFV